MPKARADGSYPAGAAYTRARKQFQVLYEKEGTFPRALAAQDLILWPGVKNDKGEEVKPPKHVLEAWAREVDDGTADISPKLREAFLKRYDAYMEATVREAVIENAKTAKAFAIQAREGKLPAEKASQYMHANNGTGFLLKSMTDRSPVDSKPRQIRNLKLLAPKKRVKELKEGVIEGEFRDVTPV